MIEFRECAQAKLDTGAAINLKLLLMKPPREFFHGGMCASPRSQQLSRAAAATISLHISKVERVVRGCRQLCATARSLCIKAECVRARGLSLLITLSSDYELQIPGSSHGYTPRKRQRSQGRKLTADRRWRTIFIARGWRISTSMSDHLLAPLQQIWPRLVEKQ